MKQPLLVNLMARFGTIVGRVYKGLMQPKTRITKDRSAVASKPPVSFFGEYERIEEAKFHTPGTEEGVPLEPGDLPDSYGETRVVLVPVDPYLVHAYWEVTPEKIREARGRFGQADQRSQARLRFYDISGVASEGTTRSYFDVDIQLQARNWYVHLQNPQRSYFAELGFATDIGDFFSVARSNAVSTPRAWPPAKTRETYGRVEGSSSRLQNIRPPAPRGEITSSDSEENATEGGNWSSVTEMALRVDESDALRTRPDAAEGASSRDAATPASLMQSLSGKIARVFGLQKSYSDPFRLEESQGLRTYDALHAESAEKSADQYSVPGVAAGSPSLAQSLGRKITELFRLQESVPKASRLEVSPDPGGQTAATNKTHIDLTRLSEESFASGAPSSVDRPH